MAAAVDGAAEGGGEQYERQNERQGEVHDADGDVPAPHHVLYADDLHFRENAHGCCGDAQSEAAQKGHQGHVVPRDAIRLGDARVGVEGAAAHLQVGGNEPRAENHNEQGGIHGEDRLAQRREQGMAGRFGHLVQHDAVVQAQRRADNENGVANGGAAVRLGRQALVLRPHDFIPAIDDLHNGTSSFQGGVVTVGWLLFRA